MKKINKKTSIFLIVIAIIVIIIMALLLWLQQGQFDTNNEYYKTMEPFTDYYKDDLVYENDGIVIPVDLKGQSFLDMSIFNNKLGSGTNLKNIWNEGGRLKANFKRMGIKIPLSFAYEYSVENGDIFLELSDMKITKNETDLSPSIEKFIRNFIGLKEEKLKLSDNDGKTKLNDILPEGFEPLSVENKRDIINMKVAYSNEAFEKFLVLLKPDNTLISQYKENNDNILADAIIIKNNRISYDKSKLVEMLFSQPKYVYDMLALQEAVELELFEEELAKFQKKAKIDESKLVSSKENMIAGYVDTYVKEVFNTFTKHFEGKGFAPSQGRPYDLDEYKLYTVKSLLASEGVNNAVPVYDKLRFVFKDNSFSLLYRIDDTKYYVRSVKERQFLSPEETAKKYGEFYEPEPPENVEKLDEDDIVSLKAYLEEKLAYKGCFYRYIRKAGDYYLLMISKPEDYQDYQLVAVKKKANEKDFSGSEILSDNIKEIRAFLLSHNDFPAQLFPAELHTTKLEKVSSDTLVAIMDEMSVRGLASGGAERIKYASYDGQSYIYFVLDDDREFVFKVEQTRFGTYLATAYEKEKAFNNWKDINVLITLE